MIYLVSLNQELFENDLYKVISPDESLEILSLWSPMIQIDSETDGRNAHINDFLCFQIGKSDGSDQVVIDTSTVDIRIYKDILESRYCVGQHLKFDLQFLYNYGIIPRKIYDTMIVEQFLHLGYPHISVTKQEYLDNNYTFPYHESEDGVRTISFALDAIAVKRLHTNIDKTVRGEIIWRGLDSRVIVYAAKDVTPLCKIMESQIKECREKNCIIGAKLECDAVPAMAYLEWCGIKLDENKWKDKMKRDNELLKDSEEALNNFATSLIYDKTETPLRAYKDGKLVPFPFAEVDLQGDLFTGFDTDPKCNIKWGTARTMDFIKFLGFDTSIKDKKTGEDKDSILEKVLKTQKGINDEFLRLYFDYQEHKKVCTTYGQGHLDAINPKTGRIHTVFRQIGASSGRMSCGSNQPDTDLAKYKGIAPSRCKQPNLQQLPSDHETRSCFVAPEGYSMVSADFSAEEARLGADIYQDKEFIKEFTEGSKDTHNMFAWIVYNKECRELGCNSASEVKAKAPQWRKKVKGFELNYPDSYR